MTSTTSNIAFGNAYSSVQANNIHGSVHIGLDNTLDRLPRAEDAPFNAFAKQHEPACLPDTRVDLLDEIYNWADSQDERCVFWLSGLAGTGKSTIARTVARRYYKEKRLAASFFFSRGGGDVGHAGKFVTSIAVQLAHNVPAVRQHISDAVAERSDIVSQSLHDQWQQLVCRPLSKLHKCESYVIVVDALDECDNEHDIRIIVQLLAEVRSSLTGVRLRVFLTSRPEVPIRHGFGQVADTEHKDVVLHDISPSIVEHDIELFLNDQFERIRGERCLRAGWPGAAIILQLVQSASGLFIWAATACRFIRDGKRFAAKRLETILSTDSSTVAAPEKHLNGIYMTVLRSSLSAEYTDDEREEHCDMLRYVFGSIVVLLSPLPAGCLGALLDVAEEDVSQTLEDLHAILNIPGDPTQPLRLHHPSFRDFLLDKQRCGDDSFWVDERGAHEKLASCCLALMSAPDGLRQDICGLSEPGTLRSEVEEETVASSLPPELQYACRYWVEHVERGQQSIADGDAVHVFLQTHLLHWLEAMSLMGETDQCVRLLARLQTLVGPSADTCAGFLRDANRFVLRFGSILAEAPLQVYSSALVFAPEASTVRNAFVNMVPQAVDMLSDRDANWDACRSVLEGHSGAVWTVVFSPNGQLLASASSDKTVRVWETITGRCRYELKGHTNEVNAVVFSADGQLLASCGDTTVQVWEMATGTCRHELTGHAESVHKVVFSPDGQLLASTSRDSTVRVWETATGACRHKLTGHAESVNKVVFSPDGQLLASASRDSTVRVWEVATGTCRHKLKGHRDYVWAVVFSPDGQLLASASDDKTVRVWETATGTCHHKLKGHTEEVTAVVFSPDGQLLASASHDKTVRVWETASGVCRHKLKGHVDWVNALLFSPDGQLLVSASSDTTVRVWETATGVSRNELEGHTYRINAVVFSPDGQLLASASSDTTVRVWETATGVSRSELKGHTSSVRAVVFSADGQLLASASHDKTVRVWETLTGTCQHKLKGHTGSVDAVVFSPDGQLLASASSDTTARLWDTATGTCQSELEGHTYHVVAVVFSPDGQLLASASRDSTVRVWETATGACRHELTGHTDYVNVVVFSPDGQLLASASSDTTVRVWETATGACRSVLKGHRGYVWAVVFSADAQLLASASNDKTVRVWETATGTCRHELEGHTDYVWAVVFSADGQLVASASTDRTVRVWDTTMGVCRTVLKDQSRYIHHLVFSPDGRALSTDKGDIPLPLDLHPTSPLEQEEQSSQLVVEGQWVLRNMLRFLWLPFEYRSYHTAAYENTVCLGCPSGRVSLLRLR